MITKQYTATDSLYPPVIAGVPTGGESRGFFDVMKTPEYLNKSDTYWRYLESREWKEKRNAVFQRENGICQGCQCEAIEHVHHSTYSHVFDELLYQLVGLCENCHRKAHYKETSWKPWKP